MASFQNFRSCGITPEEATSSGSSSGPKALVSQRHVHTLHSSAQAVRWLERVWNPEGTWVPAPHRAESRASFRALARKHLGILRLR